MRGEGLQLKIPMIQDIVPMDVRIHKSETDASASSKDLQMVHSRIAINYHIAPDKAWVIYQEVGLLYKERLIDPAVQEAVKAATAQFTAEELITRRAEVSTQIKGILTEGMLAHNILVDEFNIIDFSFSQVFNEAIEAKQTAEQQAFVRRRPGVRKTCQTSKTSSLREAVPAVLRWPTSSIFTGLPPARNRPRHAISIAILP